MNILISPPAPSGEKGPNGQSCKLVENADGSAAVVCSYDGSSYIVRGNTDNYANYCARGFYGKNCENECACQHGSCNDGVTGDGSCICEKGYYGDNCVDCTKGAEDSYYGKEECTYTDTRDANSEVIYPVVKIGDQLWMAKNMAYDDGGTDITCYANTDKDPNFLKNYGCLYTWKDANKICPIGWYLPEAGEFRTLLSKTGADSDSSSIRSKSWENSPDSSGFGVLAAGFKVRDEDFSNFGTDAYFWSATPFDDDNASYLYVYTRRAIVYQSNNHNDAFSVRCLKD